MVDTDTQTTQNSDDSTTQSGADLAQEALQAAQNVGSSHTGDVELDSSNDLAETLSSLQNVIERNAIELDRLKNEMKEKRESLRSVYDNDAQLAEAETEAQEVSQKVKERRSALKASPQITALGTQVAELREEMKVIEETLNNHLLNYFALTNTMSFDTSDGDQWDFNIRAKLKSKPKS